MFPTPRHALLLQLLLCAILLHPPDGVGSPTTRPEPTRAGAYHDRLSRFTIDPTGAAKGDATTNSESSTIETPCWVRLVRNGNTVAGFISPDGQTWNKMGESSIPLSPSITAGMALASHRTDLPNSALFDSVAVENSHETQVPR